MQFERRVWNEALNPILKLPQNLHITSAGLTAVHVGNSTAVICEEYKSWSSTLYSTNHGAPHCTARTMEVHIVQYKPPSPVLCYVLYCSVLHCLWWFRSVSSRTRFNDHPIAFLGVLSSFSNFISCCSSRMFINFVTKPQSIVACPMAVLSLHFLKMCENKILSLSSPSSVTFMELYLHASQSLVLYCTPFCVVFSIHDTRVLVGSVCKFGIRIAFVWFVTPCCLVDGYEPAKMETSLSSMLVPTYGTKTWCLLILDVCVM